MNKVRIDKWLWSVRLYKTRSRAAEACRKSHVRSSEKVLKPSYLLSVGDQLHIKKNGFNLVFKVDGLIEKRVGYPIAIQHYTDLTPPEELNKYKDWFVGKAQPEIRNKGIGRPTKRDRREIDEFKGDMYMEDFD